jgi:hypothetical protein
MNIHEQKVNAYIEVKQQFLISESGFSMLAFLSQRRTTRKSFKSRIHGT